jgi:membrane protease YdiL (CAAX protease family)
MNWKSRSAKLENIENDPTYLDQSRVGKASKWRYGLGISAILFIWLLLGGIATAVLFVFFGLVQGIDLTDITLIVTDPSLLGYFSYYLIIMVSFLFLFFGILVIVYLVHGRSPRTIITGTQRINWRRIGVGFLIWSVLLLLGTLIEFLVSPDGFSLNFEPRVFFPFALLAILFMPIQTTSEELLFRGYLVQAGSLISRNWIFLTLWSAVPFALLHIANTEVAVNFVVVMLTFFVLGAFLTWISLKDGTIELAIGVHAANNLMAALLVTFPESSLQTPAIFVTKYYDPTASLVGTVVFCVVFYLLVFVWQGRRNRQTEVESTLG